MKSEKVSADIEQLLASLAEDERSEVLNILKGMGNEIVDDPRLSTLYAMDYREVPVSPEQFLTEMRYFGAVGKHLFPLWKRDFIEIYSNPKIYHLILTGAIGIGKDFFTELCLGYELYKIACLKNPHEFFNLAPNTDIVISLISITKTQTKNVLFNQLKAMIDGSPWFCEKFSRNKDKNDIMEFASPMDTGGKYGKIRIMYGAPNNASVIGENVITAVMDEANFMAVIEKSKKVRGINKQFNQAQMVYDNLVRRMKSRYLKQGKLAGKIILLSSRQYPDDFVEKKIEELKDDPCVKVCAYSLYQMKPKSYSQTEFFWVLIGNRQVSSRILLSIDEVEDLAENEKACKIEQVPIDFLEDFKRDLDGSIRDTCGQATLTVSGFLKHRDKLFECVFAQLINPFLEDIITTDFMNGAVIDIDKLGNILNKHIPRAIHLDLSTSGDATGFAMCHVCGMKEVTHTVLVKDPIGGDLTQKVTESLPVYRTDAMLQITPPENGEIKLSLVRQLIHDLREYGFNIAIVTADQYQSKDTLQILADNGFETAALSVDTSREPYDNLKFAIYEGRFECYQHEIFLDEMTHLEEDQKKKKIDHKINGSKDLSDAVAGACWSLTKLQLWDDGGELTPTQGYSKVPDTPTVGRTKEENCAIFTEQFTKENVYDKIIKDENTISFEQLLLGGKGAK